jgi:hypothetical protein
MAVWNSLAKHATGNESRNAARLLQHAATIQPLEPDGVLNDDQKILTRLRVRPWKPQQTSDSKRPSWFVDFEEKGNG